MLPGLTPALTRASYHNARTPQSSGARLSIEKIANSPDDFLISESNGLWLLPASVADQDVAHDIARADWLSSELQESGQATAQLQRYQRISRLLGRSSVDSLGCVSGGLRGHQTPSKAVIELGEFEMRTTTQTTIDELAYLSICGNQDCYNSRHHQLDFGASRIDLKRVDLNPFWYRERSDSQIETIWGDVLPSVEASLNYFIAFQRTHFPYVPYKESRLTPTPVSQVAFHPLTGCWESYLYEKNTSGLVNIKNGYGVMYDRQGLDQVNPKTGEIKAGYRRGTVLAHNLIWEATGHKLVADLDRNHLCNYSRCCNPLHLEQIDPDQNRQHGYRARAAIRRQHQQNPDSFEARLSVAQLDKLYQPIRTRYAEIVADL